MSSQQIIATRLDSKGLSLIEVTIIIVAVGILASLALRSMTSILGDARVSETKREMDMLAKAIAGDPSIMSVAGGERSEFGYVGDVGALPANLDALGSNPGLGTWNGPYIPADFNLAADHFKKDAWGVDYSYTGGVEITSSGSGSDIVKRFAENSSDLLSNQVKGIIRDIYDSIPTDSDTSDVDIAIIYPDGTGGLDTSTCHPNDSGWFSLTSIPIGRHPVHAIYTPEVDTLTRYVTVVPRRGSDEVMRYNFSSGYFSFVDTSGSSTDLAFVTGSDTATSVGNVCCDIRFWIENTTAGPIQIDSVKLEYTTTAFYVAFDYDGDENYEFENASSRNASGDWVAFGTPETIPSGATKVIIVETFKNSQAGMGNTVDMSTTTFTVTFSDGSSFDVEMSGYCD